MLTFVIAAATAIVIGQAAADPQSIEDRIWSLVLQMPIAAGLTGILYVVYKNILLPLANAHIDAIKAMTAEFKQQTESMKNQVTNTNQANAAISSVATAVVAIKSILEHLASDTKETREGVGEIRGMLKGK